MEAEKLIHSVFAFLGGFLSLNQNFDRLVEFLASRLESWDARTQLSFNIQAFLAL